MAETCDEWAAAGRLNLWGEVPRIDELYLQKAATLSPERQAWERTLQENLGNAFYLPIHKREFVKGASTAWDFVPDDPTLARVLIIGDSISRAYTLPVRRALAGKANVHRAPENCGPTATGLKKLDVWIGSGKWDVIYFNFGIHDRATPVADYEQRLNQIIVRLRQTGASIIWASTTPIPSVPAKEQDPAAIVERNAIAARLAQKHGLIVDDLFTFITPHLAATQLLNDVHFNARGYELLATRVAASISAGLRPSPKRPRRSSSAGRSFRPRTSPAKRARIPPPVPLTLLVRWRFRPPPRLPSRILRPRTPC